MTSPRSVKAACDPFSCPTSSCAPIKRLLPHPIVGNLNPPPNDRPNRIAGDEPAPGRQPSEHPAFGSVSPSPETSPALPGMTKNREHRESYRDPPPRLSPQFPTRETPEKPPPARHRLPPAGNATSPPATQEMRFLSRFSRTRQAHSS